jgi:hypothetical protein
MIAHALALAPGDTLTVTVPAATPAPLPPPVPESARPSWFPPIVTERTVEAPATGLTAFLAGLAPRTRVEFKAGARYTLTASVILTGRSDLVLAGNGAELVLSGSIDRNWTRAFWNLIDCTRLAFHDFVLTSDSPTPGTIVIAGQREYAHGYSLIGSTYIEIAGGRHTALWGDPLCIEQSDARWSEGVWMHDVDVRSCGRNGVSVLAGRRVAVERCHFEQTGGSMLDIEPWLRTDGRVGGASNVVFQDNTATRRGAVDPATGIGMFFGAEGQDPKAVVENIVVRRNRVTGASLLSQVAREYRDASGRTLRRNIFITDNVSGVAAKHGPYGHPRGTMAPIIDMRFVEGLTVTGNRQPMVAGYQTAKAFVEAWNCTGTVAVAPNVLA